MSVGSARTPIRAVTFDLDFTLWDLTGVIERAEARSQEWLQRHHPAFARAWGMERLRDLRLRLAERHPQWRHDVTRLRREALRRAAESERIPADAARRLVEGAFEAFMVGRHEVTLYDDSLRTLQRLRGRVRLGAITNGNADLARLELSDRFDFSISAMEIGAAKPSHLVFEAAVTRAGVPREAILHVGDDPQSDVLGARRFGMQAVWLNRHGLSWPAELPPLDCPEIAGLVPLEALVTPCPQAAE